MYTLVTQKGFKMNFHSTKITRIVQELREMDSSTVLELPRRDGKTFNTIKHASHLLKSRGNTTINVVVLSPSLKKQMELLLMTEIPLEKRG